MHGGHGAQCCSGKCSANAGRYFLSLSQLHLINIYVFTGKWKRSVVHNALLLALSIWVTEELSIGMEDNFPANVGNQLQNLSTRMNHSRALLTLVIKGIVEGVTIGITVSISDSLLRILSLSICNKLL